MNLPVVLHEQRGIGHAEVLILARAVVEGVDRAEEEIGHRMAR